MKIFMLVLMIAAFCFTPLAEAVNPNINTQSSDLRSNGSNGQPGFNPCLGGTRSAAGVCSVTAPTTLLSTANVGSGGTLGLFGKLGPGAVTDNMFGIIEQPSDPANCTFGALPVGSNRLNCGQHTWFPSFQGITLPPPPLDGTNDLSGVFTSITAFRADFCANGASDCLVASVQSEMAHVAFDFNDTMTWTPLTNRFTSIVGTQSIIQVTGLKGLIGSLSSPGVGEERVEIVTSWTGISSAGADPFGIRAIPNVDFTQKFSAPDMAGTGGGFTDISSGTIGPIGGTFGTEWTSGESQSKGDTSGIQSFF